MEPHSATRQSTVACYRELAPHPALRGRVRALFSFTSRVGPNPSPRRVTFEARFAAGDRYSSPVFADGNSSIVFDLDSTFHSDGKWRATSDGHGGRVIGPMTRVAQDVRWAMPAMVGVYFHAAQLPAFLNLASGELTDRIVPIEALWGSEALELHERLAPLDESGRLDLLETALLRRMTEQYDAKAGIDVPMLASAIVARGGKVTVEALAKAAGVSRQHLTRVFRERVGVSPKLYSRLARFQSALVHARAGDGVDWARAACELGYADQSHMIAEFRTFSSLTPRMLATERWFHPFIERAKQRSTGRSGLTRDDA